ncbi:unnamed protein product [Coregonus sp. 'balchen']|nr:unnamed protein product [Coregonus sp. 'balchen']
MDPASDSFPPPLAEVKAQRDSRHTMTFHLPEEEERDLELSACSEGFEDDTDPSVAPERRRGEPPQPLARPPDSLYQLTTSQSLPHNSAWEVSPGAEEVVLAACSLSGLFL